MSLVYRIEHENVQPEIGFKTLLVCFFTGFWPILLCPIDYPENGATVVKTISVVKEEENETGKPKLSF